VNIATVWRIEAGVKVLTTILVGLALGAIIGAVLS
jgi:hypothetical protein